MCGSRPIACAIHQPNLLPRLSTLAKLCAADSWIVLDDVQFAARDYQHRARLAGLDCPGHQQWLTLPVHRPHGRASLIRDVRVLQPAVSRRRLIRLTQQYYGRSTHWSAIREILDQVLEIWDRSDRLSDIAETSTRAMLHAMGWTGTVYRSQDLSARAGRSQRLADLASTVGAEVYVCGTGGAGYLDMNPFLDAGLTVRFLNITPGAGIWQAARQVSALRAFALEGAARVIDALRAVSPQ